MQTQTQHLLDKLAWLAAMGADEAVGEESGLQNWKGRALPVVQPALRQAASRPSMLAEALNAVASFPAPVKNEAASFSPPVPAVVTAPTLESLRDELVRYESCPLKKTAMNLVFADGNPLSGIMFICDVPAEEEDRAGVPFAGQAGQLMDKMLKAIDLDRTSVYLTNLVFWRPPGSRTPSEAEIEACLPFVRRHIALVKPRLIVAMGGLTARHLLHKKESFAKVRGKWCPYIAPSGGDPIPCLPMYPPSYLLRQPAAKKQAWADLLSLKKERDTLSD